MNGILSLFLYALENILINVIRLIFLLLLLNNCMLVLLIEMFDLIVDSLAHVTKSRARFALIN